MERLQFRFLQHEDDLIAYNLLFLGHSKTHQRGIWVGRLWLPAVAVFLIAYASLVRPERLPGALIVSVLAVLWFVFWPAFRRSNVSNVIKRLVRERSNAPILGEHLVTVDDHTIRCDYPGGTSEVRWSSIIDLQEDTRLLLLYHSSIHTLLFPKDRVDPGIIDQLRQRAQHEIERQRIAAPAQAKPAGGR